MDNRKRKRIKDDSDDSSGDERSNRSPLASDNESSDTEEENDGTWTENGIEKMPKKKKRTKEKVVSDDSDSDETIPFTDGYDSDYMGDEKDRETMESMTEVDREKIIFERRERRDMLKKRYEIEKTIRNRAREEERKKRQQNQSDSEDDSKQGVLLDDRTDRRKTLDKKKNTNALDALKAEKKRKDDWKRKQDENETLDVKDVFSSDDSEDETKIKKYIGDSDSDNSDSDDDRRRRDSSSSDDDGGRRNKRTEDPEVARKRETIQSRDDLKKIKISRFRMAHWLHMSWFSRTIQGCYVRVNIGTHEHKSNYRIAEIVEVTESSKVYSLDPGDGGPRSSTNKAVKLKLGERTRDFRLCFISNSEWSESEFEFWKKQLDNAGASLPTYGEIELKEKKINNAKKHVLTDSEINKMVEEKSKHRMTPINFATKKTTLIKLRDAAETEGNLTQVEKIQTELDNLEERANMKHRERQKDISGITYINDRIKASLRKKDAICEKEWKDFREQKVDPFTRRPTCPIMVSNTNPETKAHIKSLLGERYTEDIDMRYEQKTFVKEKDAEKEALKKKTTKIDPTDYLYGVHADVDIDIDIDIP